MEGRKNGVACTIARVIQIKNAFSRIVAVNISTVLLLMVEIVKNMKPMLYTAQPLTASRAAVVTVKMRRGLMKAKSDIHRHQVSGLVLLVAIHRSPPSRRVSDAGRLRVF